MVYMSDERGNGIIGMMGPWDLLGSLELTVYIIVLYVCNAMEWYGTVLVHGIVCICIYIYTLWGVRI